MMCWVWINYRAEIWRILSNIMDNAIKFSQAGSVLMVGVKEEFLPLTVTRSKFLCVTDNSAANSLSFFFIPDGYSRRFVFKAPMVWNPFCTNVLIIFSETYPQSQRKYASSIGCRACDEGFVFEAMVSSHFPELRKCAMVVLWQELFYAKSVVFPW